jgi:hypothetical protein
MGKTTTSSSSGTGDHTNNSKFESWTLPSISNGGSSSSSGAYLTVCGGVCVCGGMRGAWLTREF